jgi:hypothetical protein
VPTTKRPRKCERCGAPATSSRHMLCDSCRAIADLRAGELARARKRRQALLKPRTSSDRGYGRQEHRKLRARLARQVSSGTAVCVRCGGVIRPGEAWDLDHSDDRTTYLGTSHSTCNRSNGGRQPPAPIRRYSRAW